MQMQMMHCVREEGGMPFPSVLRPRACIKPHAPPLFWYMLQPDMADVVSDLVLSFFCCCFYAPGDHHRGVGTHHHYSGGHDHPTGRNAAYHHRGAGSRKVSGRSRSLSLQVRKSTPDFFSIFI